MADLKISDLVAATTPLAGSELVPIVQSGATKRVTIAQLASSLTSLGTLSALSMGGNVTFATDATYDIGASGANRPRSIYTSGTISSGGDLKLNTATSAYLYADAGGAVSAGLFLNAASKYVMVVTNSINRMYWDTNGHFLCNADATYDIGASGANRPRNVFASGYIAADGLYRQSYVTIASGASTTLSVGDGLYCLALSGGQQISALLSIKSNGGSQGCYLLSTINAGDFAYGTTTEPAGGTYARIWVSAAGTITIKNTFGSSLGYTLTRIVNNA